jgi:integrase
MPTAVAADAVPQPLKLLDRLRAACRVRHYSIRTEDAYHDWCKRFILFHNKRHPLEMGTAEINAFLTDLAVRSQVSASTQNQAFCALLFLYQKVLEVDPGRIEGVVRAFRPIRLPVVLTRDEVNSVLAEMRDPYRLIVQILYGSGLRLLEALHLRVQDVDLIRGEILVRHGKGQRPPHHACPCPGRSVAGPSSRGARTSPKGTGVRPRPSTFARSVRA